MLSLYAHNTQAEILEGANCMPGPRSIYLQPLVTGILGGGGGGGAQQCAQQLFAKSGHFCSTVQSLCMQQLWVNPLIHSLNYSPYTIRYTHNWRPLL